MTSKPCLPVSRRRKHRGAATPTTTPVDFSDIQSMDATEFLNRVVQQSSQLPDILNSTNNTKPSADPYTHNNNNNNNNKQYHDANFVPIEGSAASLWYLVSDRTTIVRPPSAQYLPSNNHNHNNQTQLWVDQTLANFSKLRRYLETIHTQYYGKSSKTTTSKMERRTQPVPSMKDRPGWHIFCVGVSEARGNAGSYYDTDEEDDDEGDGSDDNKDGNVNESEKKGKDDAVKETLSDTNKEDKQSAWQQGLPEKGFYPSVSLVLQMDQVMVRRVISHLSHYIQEGWYPCSEQRAQWLYALLARLEKPVHRNDAAVLYGLLKALTRARATIPDLVEKDREGLARLNVLIAIVGVYFEQGGGLCF